MDLPPFFMDNLDNSEIVWAFHQTTERGVITGKVVGYRVTSDQVPITLMVKNRDDFIGEMPWVTIRAIVYIGVID